MDRRRKGRTGFTLVEIMVVVVIIGLLAAMALPVFRKSFASAQNKRLANDLRILGDAANIFSMETGEFPEDSNTGSVPANLSPYLPGGTFNDPSIGGSWDFEFESYGITSGVGVHGYTVPDSQLEEFDRRFDDGSLGSGEYRKIASGRYYRVLEE